MRISTAEKTSAVRALVAKYKDLPTKSLARLIYKLHPMWFDNAEAARSSVRYWRGNVGARNRKCVRNTAAELKRPNGEAGFTWSFPRSSAPDYTPFVLDDCEALILSDLHIPFHDMPAIEAVMSVARERQPNLILLNGDVCDFFSISRFDKNPEDSKLVKEIKLTRQFLGWLRQSFPKARIVYKWGNHDEWFDKFLWRKAPELCGVPGVSLEHLTTARMENVQEVGGIEWVKDQRKIMAGKLNIWHGHEIGKGSIAPPVNPARGLFMRTYECGLMGHLHKDSMHTETSVAGKLIACWSTGCLCGLHPAYARVNKWTHSAAWLSLEHGQFNVELIRILNGKVL